MKHNVIIWFYLESCHYKLHYNEVSEKLAMQP